MNMSIAAPSLIWHSNLHSLNEIFNMSNLLNNNFIRLRNQNEQYPFSVMPKGAFDHHITSHDTKSIRREPKEINPLIANPDEFRGRAIFHWDSLGDSRSEENSGMTQRSDDGVILLVGLFNLLAVVVFVGHQLLSGELSNTNKRDVFWQIQKVLDELVLRVHSSDTASALLSRALRSSENVTGREMDGNSISTFFLQTLNEKDPRKLQEMLNQTIEKLQREIFSSENLKDVQIDPIIYKPLKFFYRRLTEPKLQGRAFSSSLVQEINAITKLIHQMNLKEVQDVLRAISRLGNIHQRYDLVSLVKSMIPTKIVNAYGTEIDDQLMANNHISVFRRRSIREVERNQESKMPSRYPRFSKSALRYKAKRMKEIAEASSKTPEAQKLVQKKGEKVNKRKGVVEDVQHEDLVTNWADGWFTLLTQASPVALDISTLYTRSRDNPHCLRSFLCKANGYWRRRGTFQATLSPFLR